MNLTATNETARPPYDAGIAWRVSVELPLAADWDVLRTPLADLGLAILEQRPARELAVEARRTTRRHWDSLGGWAISTLRQMRAEYEVRLAYLDDAIADIDARGPRSLIAPHVATRLAERLVLESQLCGDVLDDLEDDLSSGATTAGQAVREAARGAGRRLDVPGEEVVLALRRIGSRAPDPEASDRVRDRLVRALATPARRAQTREWAAGFLAEIAGRVPLLAAAVAGAAEVALDSDAATDELWVGATLGLLLQHEAWRLDGPHTNELHSVRGPFLAC